MKVFISWSGEQSRQIADALREWLPMAIQAVKPYMSDRDNEAGVRWEGVVSAELNASDFGLICLTPDNLKSTWLNFEAGALGKAVDRARVVPLLYKLTFAEVERPLGMFMAKPLDEGGVKETLVAMNNSLDAEHRLDTATLGGAFEAMWPRLEEKLAGVEEHDAADTSEPRDIRKIAEETLELMRSFSGFHLSQMATYEPAARVLQDGLVLDHIFEIFDDTVAIRGMGDFVIVDTADRSWLLTPEQQRKYDQLKDHLQNFGVRLVTSHTESH